MAAPTTGDQGGDGDTRWARLRQRLRPATEAMGHLINPGVEPPRDDATLIHRASLRVRALRGWAALGLIALAIWVVLGFVGNLAGAIIGGGAILLALLAGAGCLHINRSLLSRPPRPSQSVWMLLTVGVAYLLGLVVCVAVIMQLEFLFDVGRSLEETTLGAVALMGSLLVLMSAPVVLVGSLSLIAWRTMDDLDDGLAYRAPARRLPIGPPPPRVPPPPGVGPVHPGGARPTIRPLQPPR